MVRPCCAAMRRYEALREMTRRYRKGVSAAVVSAAPLAALAGTRLEHFRGTVPCGYLHPHQGCIRHSLGFLPQAYLRALPVYFPGRWLAMYVCVCVCMQGVAGCRGGRSTRAWGVRESTHGYPFTFCPPHFQCMSSRLSLYTARNC